MELHMNPFKGRHFQRDIILWAVRWYCKYGISYRELQEMLAERGVNVDHSTIYRWVQRYAPEMEKRLRWYWRNPSDLCPWHMDETYVKVNGAAGRICTGPSTAGAALSILSLLPS
jgi:IS6 family transposase